MKMNERKFCLKDCSQMEAVGLRCYCHHAKNYVWKDIRNEQYIQDDDCLVEYEDILKNNH